ncbi:MAG: hypothetical protein IJB86_10485 [Clostridia bacterium]|nr:hypothetical protein [Clostridia bacterium]
MKILLCYEKIPETMNAVSEILSENGFDCEIMHYENSESLQKYLRKNDIGALVSSENRVLSRCKNPTVPKVFVASDYCCLQKLSAKCDLYTVPSHELSFDFINSGATDKNVSITGIPICKSITTLTDKKTACKNIGINGEKPVFAVFTQGASGREVRTTVNSVLLLCKETRVILAVADSGEKTYYSSLYCKDRDVYVIEEKHNGSLCISASDAVFTVARAEMSTAVARACKSLILLHSATARYKENASFFDKRGIGFCGKTAADNASYAGRLLESVRLKHNMTEAQKKYIPTDTDQLFLKNFYTFSEKF